MVGPLPGACKESFGDTRLVVVDSVQGLGAGEPYVREETLGFAAAVLDLGNNAIAIVVVAHQRYLVSSLLEDASYPETGYEVAEFARANDGDIQTL